MITAPIPKSKVNCGCGFYNLTQPVESKWDKCQHCGNMIQNHFTEGPKNCERCALYTGNCEICDGPISLNRTRHEQKVETQNPTTKIHPKVAADHKTSKSFDRKILERIKHETGPDPDLEIGTEVKKPGLLKRLFGLV